MGWSMFYPNEILCDPAPSKLITKYHPTLRECINECPLDVFIWMK
jgi:hypothetical protein